MMECVLYLFIMRLFVGLSWCDSVLCSNQLILLWVYFCVGAYMYYIGATVSSYGGVSFFYVVRGCTGLICFSSRLVLIDLKIVGLIKIINQFKIEYLNRIKELQVREYGELK